MQLPRIIDIAREDIAAGLRHLGRRPGLAAVGILTIALGIGAATAAFSLVRALILRPVAAPEPERLVVASAVDRRGHQQLIGLDAIAALAAEQHSFETLGGYSGGGLVRVDANGVQDLRAVEVVTGSYFASLGIQPYLGRLISPSDAPDTGATAHVVVLRYGFWQERFGGDPHVVGQTLRVDGMSLRIIGVTPPDFTGLQVDVAPDLTFPLWLMRELDTPPNPTRMVHAHDIFGRVRPGVTPAQAGAELKALWPSVHATFAPAGLSGDRLAAYRSEVLHVESIANGFSNMRNRYGTALEWLLALTGLLLLVACVNMGGLLLSDTAARRTELAVRVVLGAGRARLSWQMLTESLLLTSAGVVLAVPFAWLTSRAVGAILWTGSVPMTRAVTPDGSVLVVACAAALATGLGVGVLPVWVVRQHTSNSDGPTRGFTHRTGRFARGLLVAQVALSVVLLFSAGLLSRSLFQLQHVDLGFGGQVLVARLVPEPNGYQDLDPAAYYRQLHDDLVSLPGVTSVSFSSVFPAPILAPQTINRIDGRAAGAVDGAMDMVSPGFFRTVGMTVVRGRDFDWHDTAQSRPVALVNETLARRLFGTAAAIGRQIRIGADAARSRVEIIGVVHDARMGDLHRVPVPMVFRPYWQEVASLRVPLVEIRAPAISPGLADGLRRVVAAAGREYYSRAATLDELTRQAMVRERALGWAALILGGLAALLVGVGIYALLAYAFTRRAREMGVRLALGASRAAIVRMIAGQALALAVGGALIGAPAALLAGHAMASLLFQLSPGDPATLAAVVTLTAAIALAAGARPALRASRVDPMTTLRAE